jgi:hypothetical protein
MPRSDVIIIDGDHNYYTLSRELQLIQERWPGAEMPLLMMHDVSWPLARRDAYEDAERIPKEHRQPLARGVGLVPGDAGVNHAGLRFVCVAEREGGPRNGVLTAIEDFVADQEELSLGIVPAFFGFALLWHKGAPWASTVADIVAPFDRNPMLERLEKNRVAHLIARLQVDLELDEERDFSAREELLLKTISASSAFALAERLSSLKHRGRPAFSREAIARLLEQDERRNGQQNGPPLA